jgi:hypothetical protein
MPGSLGNLGGVSYDIIAEDKTQNGTSSAVASLARVTAAFASVAAASHLINQATDAYDKMSQTSVLTSAKLGVSVSTMNEAVKQAARDNKDFVSETSEGFDLLARSGEESLDAIAKDYKIFSDLGEVTGQSAVAVEYQVIPALKAFGLEVSDVASYQDVFTSVTRDTTMSLGEFTGFISRSALNLKALNLDITDTAAIFEIMADRGIQGRQAMRVFSQAMQDQAEQTRVAEKAASDYADTQEKLKEAQDDVNLSIAEYNMRMGFAGSDVARARQLTMERRVAELRESAKKEDLETKASAAQSVMQSAQSAPFDVYKALGVTPDEVQAKKDLIESNKGLTESLAAGVESYNTATESWAQQSEQTRLAMGEMLEPIKGVTAAVNTLSTVLTVVGTGATVLQAVGALKGGGGLGGIAGGLGKLGGAGGLAGGAGGIAEGLGVGSAGAMAGTLPAGAAAEVAMGGEVFAPMAAGEAGSFAAMAEGGALAGGGGAAGTSLGALALPALAGIALGGGIAYGLESLGLLGVTGKGAVRSTGEVVGGAAYGAGRETRDVMSVVFNGGVQLSKDYDFKQFMKDIETYQSIKRMQKGM